MTSQAKFRFPIRDLDEILTGADVSFRCLKDATVFITGGTGFYGQWLIESLIHANQKRGLNIRISVLSRSRDNPLVGRFPEVDWVFGDILNFNLDHRKIDYVVHAATPVVKSTEPLDLWRVIVDGTLRALAQSERAGARRFLLTSSGAIYGPQPPAMTHFDEDYNGAPAIAAKNSTYGHGKRVAEHLCSLFQGKGGLDCTIGRFFANLGPGMETNAQFAIGNFIRDALMGEKIVIKSDGSGSRSYLYMTDLIIWMLRILTHGVPLRPYNVGSSNAISIKDLAGIVAEAVRPDTGIEILGKSQGGLPATVYVPSNRRITSELELNESIPLREAIIRTANWFRNEGIQ